MVFEIVDYQTQADTYYTGVFKDDLVFDAIIKSLVAPLQDYQVFLNEYNNTYLDIDSSIGAQLDIIGGIVGQPRQLINYFSDPYFGFVGAAGAQSFGTTSDGTVGGVWRSITKPLHGTVRTLDDDTYKRLLKARIIKNKSRGTVNDFLAVINILAGNTLSRVDVGTYSGTAIVTLVSPVDPLVGYFLNRVSLEDSIIPKPLGVKLFEAVVDTVPSCAASAKGLNSSVFLPIGDTAVLSYQINGGAISTVSIINSETFSLPPRLIIAALFLAAGYDLNSQTNASGTTAFLNTAPVDLVIDGNAVYGIPLESLNTNTGSSTTPTDIVLIETDLSGYPAGTVDGITTFSDYDHTTNPSIALHSCVINNYSA